MSSPSPPGSGQEQAPHHHQQDPRRFSADRRYIAATQQALFQAYLHAIRTGQFPMPNLSPASTMAKTQQQANHNRTISDAKRGVTYAGQEQLKKLPIPPLEDTCQRYLDSVKPFLVNSKCGWMLTRRLLESFKIQRVSFKIFRTGKGRGYRES